MERVVFSARALYTHWDVCGTCVVIGGEHVCQPGKPVFVEYSALCEVGLARGLSVCAVMSLYAAGGGCSLLTGCVQQWARSKVLRSK
jgi:hypothetical protein